MSQAFGTGSPEWSDAVASNAAPSGTAARARALTDYVGIAIHCAQGGGICAGNATNVANSRPDRLPDEPGGYLGYKALYGAKYVNPALCATPGASCQAVMGRPAVNSTAGDPVTDPFGQPGFPGFDGALAKNTLGYLAQMQEAGIPITWGYISDAHDNHTSAFPAPFNPAFPRASGPGEADYNAQLKAYDDAFAAYFERLKNDGIDQSNTLFMVTVDEGDQFAGGIGTPQADGSLAYSHTNCSLDDDAGLPGESDRRGQPEHQAEAAGCPVVRRAQRLGADLLRQRSARSQRRDVAAVRTERSRAERDRPLQQPHCSARVPPPGGPGRGKDAAHGQQRPGADADVHRFR